MLRKEDAELLPLGVGELVPFFQLHRGGGTNFIVGGEADEDRVVAELRAVNGGEGGLQEVGGPLGEDQEPGHDDHEQVEPHQDPGIEVDGLTPSYPEVENHASDHDHGRTDKSGEGDEPQPDCVHVRCHSIRLG